MELFLFKPSAPGELFQYSIQRVHEGLAGSEECFDWLLTAEEFHGDVKWLKCVRSHGPQLSGQEQVIKMIDILCVQRQVLYSGESTDDRVFIAVKDVSY